MTAAVATVHRSYMAAEASGWYATLRTTVEAALSFARRALYNYGRREKKERMEKKDPLFIPWKGCLLAAADDDDATMI